MREEGEKARERKEEKGGGRESERRTEGEGESVNYEEQFLSVNTLTCGLPQSQASFPSLIPLPQTGSPTVMVGTLVRQRPRLKVVSPVLRSALLQLLH